MRKTKQEKIIFKKSILSVIFAGLVLTSVGNVYPVFGKPTTTASDKTKAALGSTAAFVIITCLCIAMLYYYSKDQAEIKRRNAIEIQRANDYLKKRLEQNERALDQNDRLLKGEKFGTAYNHRNLKKVFPTEGHKLIEQKKTGWLDKVCNFFKKSPVVQKVVQETENKTLTPSLDQARRERQKQKKNDKPGAQKELHGMETQKLKT